MPKIAAVFVVETTGACFLAERRTTILFERHKFSSLTNGQFDTSNLGISSPAPGGYGAAGAYQYIRLADATALDRESALKSESWGIGQVTSEESQLDAVGSFIVPNGLVKGCGSRQGNFRSRL